MNRPLIQPADSQGYEPPFWAKVTATDPSSGLSSWVEQQDSPAGFFDMPGGRFGSAIANPLASPNSGTLLVGFVVLAVKSYLDPVVDWVYRAVSDDLANVPSCDGFTLTEEQVRCESGALNVYARTVTLNTIDGCLSKVVGPWALSRVEGSCAPSGAVTNINYSNIEDFTTYVSNVLYFNAYDNRIYINIAGIWVTYCECSGSSPNVDAFWYCIQTVTDPPMWYCIQNTAGGGGGAGTVLVGSTTVSDSNTLTWTPVLGEAGLLVVNVSITKTAGDVTGVTYNGVSMTKSAEQTSATTEITQWYLVVTAGTHNVVISTVSSGKIASNGFLVTGLVSNVPDVIASTSGSGGTVMSGGTTSTSASSNEVAVAGFSFVLGAGFWTWHGTPTFTGGDYGSAYSESIGMLNLTSGKYEASATGTFNPTVTITSGTLGDWAGLVVAYK